MKTLTKIALPIAVATLLAVPAAYADHDRDRFRDHHDRYSDYRHDSRDGFYSRDARRHLAEYERDRRKRLAEAARQNRKHHAAHVREYNRHLRDARHDHRHVTNCRHWSHYDRVGGYNPYRHNDVDFWSVVVDVAFAY